MEKYVVVTSENPDATDDSMALLFVRNYDYDKFQKVLDEARVIWEEDNQKEKWEWDYLEDLVEHMLRGAGFDFDIFAQIFEQHKV
jgi:hypothetical protein